MASRARATTATRATTRARWLSRVGTRASRVGRRASDDGARGGSGREWTDGVGGPTTGGHRGWSALETWRELGVVWNFITPSSPEGRTVIKRAHAAQGNKLRGISNWRKARWDEASAQAPIAWVDSHTPLPGCRGYRVCWASASAVRGGAKRAVVMFYCAATRKFYFEADVRAGGMSSSEMDAESHKTPEEILESQKRILTINQVFAGVYESMKGSEDATVVEYEAYEDTLLRQTAEAKQAAKGGGAGGDDDAQRAEHIFDAWAVGDGVTPMDLYFRAGLNFDFHGPAGTVMRSIVAAVAESRGMDVSDSSSWSKQKWEDAATELRITAASTHASLAVIGRGWKVCWTDQGDERGAPPVMLWAPEEGKYFSIGAIRRKGSCAGNSIDTVLRALVGVVNSVPPPKGLKEALKSDADFLHLADIASSGTKTAVSPQSDSYDDSEEGTVYVEVEDEDEDEDEDEEAEEIAVDSTADSVAQWKDVSRRAQTDYVPAMPDFRMDDTSSFPPGAEPIDDGYPSSLGEFTQTEAMYSRSAGYLSFVEDEFNDDDLKRELGIARDDMYRGPKDFPDLSKATPTETDGALVDLREVSPNGLPKPAESYHVLALDGVDFIVSKTNDGRLDLREVYSARRNSIGRFIEDAQRVNTAEFMSLPPAYYQEINWTEVRVSNEEDFDGADPIPSFNTTTEKTTKIYLVFARNAPSEEHMFDRALDFTKPVVEITAEGDMRAVAVGGATSSPDASLIIKNGELYCQDASDIPPWKDIIDSHGGNDDSPSAHKEFLTETDTDIETQAYAEEEDTPEIDQM